MITTTANYLLSPRAAQLRVHISAVLVAVAVVVFVASPGLWVTGPWLASVLAWGAVTVSAYRRARTRPVASISAPNAGQLASGARDGRRHAVEFGLPIDPWTQLEGFWCAAGVQVAVEDIAPGVIPKVAHLVGPQTAINTAHAVYMRGLRERAAAGKVT